MDIRDFSMDLFSLSGKTAIVTGGNTGLGQAFSLALAKAGADLFIPTVADDAGETKGLAEQQGRRAELLEVDLTEPRAPRHVVERCLATYGRLDILVNSAGICNLAPVEDFGREQWDPMIALNLTAAFELSFEASTIMVAQRSGKIINICSLFSYLGGQWSPAYAATKHGLAGFTKAYCDELAEHNVQVNGIAPGYFATAITEATRADEERNRRVLERVPAGRWGDVADLMGATVFLASSASDYVNGHVLVVDGGYLVR
ncbi:MAG TPA: SDR family oxidoreductase [Acidimicrobiales bacterium]|nr:SDR family oxidoreductase [Acidimicrobiales bacterium]